jgi:hypothetical protein
MRSRRGRHERHLHDIIAQSARQGTDGRSGLRGFSYRPQQEWVPLAANLLIPVNISNQPAVYHSAVMGRLSLQEKCGLK